VPDHVAYEAKRRGVSRAEIQRFIAGDHRRPESGQSAMGWYWIGERSLGMGCWCVNYPRDRPEFRFTLTTRCLCMVCVWNALLLLALWLTNKVQLKPTRCSNIARAMSPTDTRPIQVVNTS
jgi:hypothetical protein